MADNPSKLQNIQLPTQPSDGLASGVVETDSLAGGAIDGGTVTGAAEKGVERRPCDCKDRFPYNSNNPIMSFCCGRSLLRNGYEDVYCRVTERNLP